MSRVLYDSDLCPSLPGMDRCRDPDFLLLCHRPGGPHSLRQLQSLQQQLLQVGTRLCPTCPALPCPGAVGLPKPEHSAPPPPGTPSSWHSSTVGPASLLGLWSSPSWALWPQSRVCTSPRWQNQVSCQTSAHLQTCRTTLM